MKKINLRSLILTISFTLLAVSVNAQNITSISQIKDVKPTDKYYSALQSLVERYGVFSDRTFRSNDPLTREEFVVLLNDGLNRMIELAAAAEEEVYPSELIENFSANETNITSISQIKDINTGYNKYLDLQSLTERYLINICDKDKYFRPTKPVTEKEFYTWVTKIFRGSINSNPSATKAVSRSDWAIVMNQAFDSVNETIATLSADRKSKRQVKKQEDLIRNLPSKGRAKITNPLYAYFPDNTCRDFTNASNELKQVADQGGILNGYKMKNDDIGDIIFETNNTCKKDEKLVLLRIGTAIVTISPEGIERLK
jgi:hypothetical protein